MIFIYLLKYFPNFLIILLRKSSFYYPIQTLFNNISRAAKDYGEDTKKWEKLAKEHASKEAFIKRRERYTLRQTIPKMSLTSCSEEKTVHMEEEEETKDFSEEIIKEKIKKEEPKDETVESPRFFLDISWNYQMINNLLLLLLTFCVIYLYYRVNALEQQLMNR